MTTAPHNESLTTTESAVAQGSAFDVIRKRMRDQGEKLDTLAKDLNQKRLAEFGSTEFQLLGRTRVHTEHNCVARDIIRVGEYLLFAYNVFVGLKKNIAVQDVFALYRLTGSNEAPEMEVVPYAGSFLDDTRFISDFNELYTYYKQATLLRLAVRNNKVLASFQIGERVSDVRVFRWSITSDGSQVNYIDNRGERDIELPPACDFAWQPIAREQIVEGRHPHINIADTLFVDTIGGDLTVKVENNTSTGKGIYSEPVSDPNQSLDDAEFFYASLGQLILLKIRPYREEDWRYLVFNKLNETVTPIAAIGDSCVQLPDSHGIIYPGGCYLQAGDNKSFEEKHPGLRFQSMLRSPNGEDVLFTFYEAKSGVEALYPYNLINKQLRTPLYAHGFGHFEDGRAVVFYVADEPTRVHPMQIWQTPYVSDLYASQARQSQSLYGRIGNSELVKGVSDLLSVCHLITKQDARSAHFHEIRKFAARLLDQYHWLSTVEHKPVETVLKDIIETSALVLDEFEKVDSIRKSSEKTLDAAIAQVNALKQHIQPDTWHTPQPFVQTLVDIRRLRGHLLSISEYRYIDMTRIDALGKELEESQQALVNKTVEFLASDNALLPLQNELTSIETAADACSKKVDLTAQAEKLEMLGQGLDLLTQTVGGITHADATVQTDIIERVSALFALLNQAKARLQNKIKSLGSAEAQAQFGAQFKLLAQSITNGLSQAQTPEKCDEQLARIMAQLQELESRFGEYDQFLSDIFAKREEIFDAFETQKRQLLDERQRKAQTLHDAAKRIIDGLKRRTRNFQSEEDLQSFLAADPLLEKLRQLSMQLRAMGDTVKADDIDAETKSAKDNAVRSLRDKADIFEEGGNIIKLGHHRFSVNTQELELSMIPRERRMYFHLAGTEYFDAIDNEAITAHQACWNMTTAAESEQVSRAEYLAYSFMKTAEAQQEGLSLQALHSLAEDNSALLKKLHSFIESRYRDGYERGIHDHDAAKLLEKILPLHKNAGTLRYDPTARAMATLFVLTILDHTGTPPTQTVTTLSLRAKAAHSLANTFGSHDALDELKQDIRRHLSDTLLSWQPSLTDAALTHAAEYLVEELTEHTLAISASTASQRLEDEFAQTLRLASLDRIFEDNLRSTQHLFESYDVATHWLSAFIRARQPEQARYIPEIAVRIVGKFRGSPVSWKTREINLNLQAEGLLSTHISFHNGKWQDSLDSFLTRLQHHAAVVIPAFQTLHEHKARLSEQEKKRLRLEQFKPKPLSSFVRNRLINEVYLPIIGANLAKQMGTVGDSKRSDLMGLLMLISPPGYGKTTLMEYVAHRLGLIFMKINCPSLGHSVHSLDPTQAPNATARQEVEKINLALEMGNNVMLYLDDIQHTHAEFLQKFISLCDGTRRIDGVWKDQSKTYDMRGKKFCIAMAGNPYTESGELFKIPDMLANRADIYNLGDVLGGMDEVFGLSYIENAMTSNPVLAPLAVRPMEDFYRLVNAAKGQAFNDTDLKHPYSAAEIREIVDTLKKLFALQSVVLKVNLQYIASAAQDDKFRTEPPFKLQGSYRNMNKMAEKISAVMTSAELMQLLDDHYRGEAQLLTTGTEANLLKLKEIRGLLDEEATQRWQSIKAEYQRHKRVSGDGTDAGTRMVAQLDLLNTRIASLQQPMTGIETAIGKLDYQIEVVNQPQVGLDLILKSIADTLENSFLPLVKLMDGKLNLDLKTHEKMGVLVEELRSVSEQVQRQTTQG